MFLLGRRFFTVFLLFLCIAPLGLCAQEVDTTDAPKKRSYIASYWHNGIGLVASPFHWKGDDWAKFGGTVVITGLTVLMDEAIADPFFRWQNATGKAFGDGGYTVGSVPFQIGLSGAALGVGVLAKSKPIQNFALDNLQAQIFTSGFTVVVKELAHRSRPREGLGAYEWGGPFDNLGNQSFFSGHASVAFSTATMVFLHSKKKWWVGLISYGIATGVSLSRMQRQAHWGSDILMGAVVGSAISTYVYKQQEKRRNPVAKLKLIP
jgi:hypothetical protein